MASSSGSKLPVSKSSATPRGIAVTASRDDVQKAANALTIRDVFAALLDEGLIERVDFDDDDD